jgi:hypothetical protein
MSAMNIKNYAIAVEALSRVNGEAEIELKTRVLRLLEAQITEAEEGTDRPPIRRPIPRSPTNADDIPF